MLRNSCPTIVALLDPVHDGVPFHKQCRSCRGLVCFVLWHDFVVLFLLSMLLNSFTGTDSHPPTTVLASELVIGTRLGMYS
jgi:hypothetical protein